MGEQRRKPKAPRAQGKRSRPAGPKAAPVAKEPENDFRDLVSNLPVGIYRTTPDGRILMANPALIMMLGFPTFEELSKRNLESGRFQDYPRAEFKERLAKTGFIRGLESGWVKADGSTIQMRESVRAVRGPDGQVKYFEGAVEDITEQKQTEEELRNRAEFLEEVISNASVGILVIDEDNKYVLLNPASGAIVGHWPDDWTGKQAGMNVHPDDQGMALAHFIQALSGETTEFDLRIEAADRTYKHCHINLSPLNLMGKSCVLGFVNDITERKRLEEEAYRTQSRSMLEIIMIAMSVFMKKLQPAEIDQMLGEFGTLLEKYLRPIFESEMERMMLEEKEPAIASDPTERLFKRYLKWLSNLHTRFGMRSEPLGHGMAASLNKTKCSWLDAAKVNPIHCRICDMIAQKSFAWSDLKGKVSITGTIAGGAARCHYEFALS